MEGRIDVFVAGIGTGGTVSGVARYLKERDPAVRVVAVDIAGSVFTDHFRTGRHGPPGPYLVEGLGDEEVIACPEFERIDEMLQATDRDAFLAARELARSEALFAGGSSGAALWGVREVARRLAPEGARGRPARPARIVTLFPDSGTRYLSTIYNDDWMRGHGFLDEAEAAVARAAAAADDGLRPLGPVRAAPFSHVLRDVGLVLDRGENPAVESCVCTRAKPPTLNP